MTEKSDIKQVLLRVEAETLAGFDAYLAAEGWKSRNEWFQSHAETYAAAINGE